MKVLAIAEHNNHELLPATLHTVNAAKQIGDTDLLVVGHNCQEVIDNASKVEGINQVLYCNNEMYKNLIAENLSVLIKSIAQNYSHILFSNTANGKNTAPRLAALLDVMIVPDIIEIIDANIFTSINKEFAANTFITKFLHHDRPFTKSDLKELSNRIIKNFDKFEKIGDLETKSKKIIKFQNILSINESLNKEKGRNLITIETSDRQGLLSEIAKVFFKQNVSILSARINTLGDRVEDTFEIENFNANIVPNYKMKKIKSALKKVL